MTVSSPARPRAAFAFGDPDDRYRVFSPDAMARLVEATQIDPDLVIADITADDCAEVLAEVEVLITFWGGPLIDETVLARAPRLNAVVHAGGSVKPHITSACWQRGIAVSSAAAANAIPVAEFALAAILLLNKDAFRLADRLGRSDPVDYKAALDHYGNYGSVVGVVGASRVGRHLLTLLRPFSFEVLVADPFATAGEIEAVGARLVDLDELVAHCDIVSLHAPALPETHHLLDRRRLALMRDGAGVVNTSRGSLVDIDALKDELVSGRLTAVLDVVGDDHIADDPELVALPNVFVTPHIAGSFGNELRRLGDSAVAEVERYCAGHAFQYPVDPSALAHEA